MTDDAPSTQTPEEDPSKAYQSNCLVAAILAFGSPIFLIFMLMTGNFTALALCPILGLLSVVGFIWGLVSMIVGDPAKKQQKAA